MKQGWTYKKFTDVCEVQYGYAFDSKCFTDDEKAMPLIRIRDVMRGYSETFYNGDIPEGYIINEGDYLVGMDGEFNIGRWGKRPGLLNQRVCKMYSSNETLDNGYMYYFMKVCLKKIEDETPFVTVKHLSSKRINQIQIPLPPLSTQQSIVSELDKINELIRLKKEQLSDYDKLAQSLFYEMFGDPVENEKGWKVKKLIDVVSDTCTISYGIVQPGDGVEDGIPVVRPVDLIYDYIYPDNLKKTTIEISNSYKRSILEGNEILMCVRGTTGIVSMATSYLKGCNVTRGIVPIQAGKDCNKQFLFRQFRTSSIASSIAEKTYGATLKQINMKDLRELPVILPPLPLQQLFAQRIELIEAQKAQITSTIRDLETLLASRMQYWFE